MTDDDKLALLRPWRGPLFQDFMSPLMWKDGCYRLLEPPKSVTFPICTGCGLIVWDWPHYEEEVPDNAICTRCFKEVEEDERRERDRW